MKTCKICGISIESKRKNKSYCSYYCYGLARRKKNYCIDCHKEVSLRKETKRCFECNKIWCVGKNRGKVWKGGITPENKKRRYLTETANWRNEVFKRDNYTCQICGKVGGRLQADHIKRWSKYPKLRLDIDNGRTLCVECHKLTDNYGNKGLVKVRDNKGKIIKIIV